MQIFEIGFWGIAALIVIGLAMSLMEALGKLGRAVSQRLHGTAEPKHQAPPAEPAQNATWDGEPNKTLRQSQHEWYEGHSELNWQDRTTAEAYGMSVDEYINNYKERD